MRALIAAVTFLALVCLLAALGRMPWAVVGVYAAASALAFVAYGADKSAAQSHRWRTSESTLHLFALFGGWPGALVAQQMFRHKTRKAPFRTMFWATVIVNCLATVLIVYLSTVVAPG